MVCANYCAPYPKQPCVVHEANMWYPCYVTSFVLDSPSSFSVSCDPTLTLFVLKIENRKIKQNENKKCRVKWKETKSTICELDTDDFNI